MVNILKFIIEFIQKFAKKTNFLASSILGIFNSYLKQFLFEQELKKIDSIIKTTKQEVEDDIEKSSYDYDDFSKLYESYKSGKSDVRPSTGEMRDNSSEPKKGD